MGSAAIDDAISAIRAVFRPPPRLSVSAWADAHRQLSSEASAEPGQWRTSRAEYQRAILNAISDPLVHTVVVKSSAQVGKSELLLNAIGYYMHQDAAPILFLQPTIEMAETFAKDRIAPMLRDTPALAGLVADPKARDSGNTILHKLFPGGHLTLAGANSPASLASRPVRIVLCDEVDRYPPSAGSEGDPVTLVKARQKTFWNRKLVLTSTPTIKGASRIESAYEESDQRILLLACPHCGTEQRLLWGHVRWPAGKPQHAAVFCSDCGASWTDAQRWAAIRKCKWQAQAEFKGVAGFALSELNSPWARVADMAVAFLQAKESRSQERMRAWINTSLGETWEQDGERIDDTIIAGRVEEWSGIPDGVLFTTLGVDVQDDRLEMELVGWGVNEESWSLDYHVIFGDPSAGTLWNDLERYIGDHKPAATCIDSGGHYTQSVYAFCKGRLRQRIYAVKGMAGPGRLVWPKKASRNAKVALFIVGVDAAKDQIYAHLKHSTAGPGFCHFPKGRGDDYFAGLAAETVVTRYSKGFPIREYKRRSNARNEPLDCRVYAYAALCSLNVKWANVAAQAAKRREAKQAPIERPEEPAPTPVSQEAQRPLIPVRHAGRRVGRIGGPNGWR